MYHEEMGERCSLIAGVDLAATS